MKNYPGDQTFLPADEKPCDVVSVLKKSKAQISFRDHVTNYGTNYVTNHGTDHITVIVKIQRDTKLDRSLRFAATSRRFK